MKFLATFKPESYYHIFNHAIGDELLFKTEENNYYFLKKYAHYILPIAKTYAYCLMPNHFHLFIQFKAEEEIVRYATTFEESRFSFDAEADFHKFLMQQFSNFLNSYTKSYNKVYKRKGALFLDYTRRVEINHSKYFKNVVSYIHNNPVKHGFCTHPEEWKFSSYQTIFRDDATKIERAQLLEWFNDTASLDSYKRGDYCLLPEIYSIE